MPPVKASPEVEDLPPPLPAKSSQLRSSMGSASPSILPGVPVPPPKTQPVAPSQLSNTQMPSTFVAQPLSSSSGQEAGLSIPWAMRNSYAKMFAELPKVSGMNRAAPDQIKQLWMSSGLPVSTLRKIWFLCDPQKSGSLSEEEFTLSMHLFDQVKLGYKADILFPQ
ncbi:hypothetical protein Pelo_1873 [Pelomyxa schiedti]|nr:hypothetical protein Pelo_1873 [Pelomyxa schiedti]